MSISPQLQASARAAYRSIFRAAASTFAGDPEIRRAFTLKTRGDFEAGRLETDEGAYTQRIKLANEIAQVLRKNLVQGRLREDGTYRLRITSDTELGSNETIKNPAPLERPSRARRRAKEATQTECGAPSTDNVTTLPPTSSSIPHSLNYSVLKRASRKRQVPVLNEDDLEETFIKGGGPGGQCINKRSTNVDLLHKPSGIRVKCQETRSLQDNRRIARKLIIKKAGARGGIANGVTDPFRQLDALQNPGLSKEELRDARVRERKRRSAKKARKKKTGDQPEQQ